MKVKQVMMNVDTKYIGEFLKKKGIRECMFSESLGYQQSWWGYVKSNGGRVKKNVVALMCRMYHMDEDKVVIKPEPEPETQHEPVYSDDNIRVLITTMVRIEQKLNILLDALN